MFANLPDRPVDLFYPQLQKCVAMLLFIAATTTLLPLVCFIGSVTCSEGGGSYQLSQSALLPKRTQETDGITTFEKIDLTIFKWLYSMTDDVTNLTICTRTALIKGNETVKNNPTLLYLLEEGKEKNIVGVVDDGNSSCSVFTEKKYVPLPANETLYELSLLTTHVDEIIYKSGYITFGMPVVTSTLHCNEKPYTRVARLPSDITLDFNGFCFNDDQQLGNESVCYLEGEFSSSYLCYTTNAQPELQICLQGSNLTTADEADGELTISYLAYDSDGETAGAHLSLEFEETQPTRSMEAIIWKDGIGSATSCLNTSCIIQSFTQGFVQYDVCAVILVDDLANKTSTDIITDLDAHAFAYNDSSLLQFDFRNANEEQYYTAYLVNVTTAAGEVDNSTVDCTAVPLNKTCHGYFEADFSACDLRVAVEYSDAKRNSKGNMIMFACEPISENRRKETKIRFGS